MPSHDQTLLGFFFALTGALIATSIINIGDSGVPLFCLALAMPAAALIFAGFWSQYFTFSRSALYFLLSIGSIFLLLCVATFFQIALNIQSPSRGLPHAVIRLSFLAYCVVCVVFLRGGTLLACLRWLRRILAILALYGVYQLPAKLLGLPLFLDWLRNNHSFSLYNYDTAGWVSLVRATSIYAEPAQCAVPVVVLVLLNIYLPAPRFSKKLVWVAVTLFALLTFSRTIWVAIFALIIAMIVSRSQDFRRQFQRHTVAFSGLLLLITLMMPIWAFLGSNYKADLSRQERAGSVVIGLQLVKQHPILGSGWNSYETLMPGYQIDVENVSPDVTFSTIHNMFVSYAQQAGIAGFLLALFPFAVMLFLSEAPLGLRLASVLSLLTAAELGGDVAYSSLFWLWVAIILNWKHQSIGVVRADLDATA